MIVDRVERKAEFTKLDVVKYQLITHCYFKDIVISDAAATCFARLCLTGKIELSKFCRLISDDKIFATPQTVRNAVTEAEKKELIIKEGKDRKLIYINPELNIRSKGNILLDFKFLSRESI